MQAAVLALQAALGIAQKQHLTLDTLMPAAGELLDNVSMVTWPTMTVCRHQLTPREEARKQASTTDRRWVVLQSSSVLRDANDTKAATAT